MKRLIAVVVLLALAHAAQAANSLQSSGTGENGGWLYWTLDLADTWGDWDWYPSRPDTLAAGTYDVWLVAESANEKHVFRDATYPEQITLDGTGLTGDIGGVSTADLALLTDDLAAYTFYSVIGTYEGLEEEWTGAKRAYGSLGAFIQADEVSPADVWNTAILPEPTSALLVLFGLAGLALRRGERA